MLDSNRLVLKKTSIANKQGNIAYWMSRDIRTNDNEALLYAQKLAIALNKKLFVFFYPSPNIPIVNQRSWLFLWHGLNQVANDLAKLNIPFHLCIGELLPSINDFLNLSNCSHLIYDFDPLKYKKQWRNLIIDNLDLNIYEIDTHNIVPYFKASNKLEFAAYTIRLKINKLLNEYLVEPKQVVYHSNNQASDFNNLNLNIDSIKSYYTNSPNEIGWLKAGEDQAHSCLNDFISNRLNGYNVNRNNPNLKGQSNLSPYLHYGQISALRIALEVNKSNAPDEDKEAYLEELIVRKELSDNFCYYNHNYDNFDGIHSWAKTTLNEHRIDKRQYYYSIDQFENALTHDRAWNAAQKEMLITGKMHGYMRMYWAKKILEWTSTPEEAFAIAIYLNDKYSIDGRDPNGYVGIAWSIGGVHDRAWNERQIFGKVRYMNYDGLKRKFKIQEYENKWLTGSSLF